MTVLTVPIAETASASITRRTRVLRRLRRNPLAVVSFVVLALAIAIALLSPWLAPYSVDQTDFARVFVPPGSPGHVLGTDDLGRDVLSRIMLGARASLQVGLLAVATSLVLGVPLGLAAGYFRAWDAVISRFTDLLLAFPFLIMAVGLAAIRGPAWATPPLPSASPRSPG